MEVGKSVVKEFRKEMAILKEKVMNLVPCTGLYFFARILGRDAH